MFKGYFNNIDSFYGSEGSLAFFIPFSFSTTENENNLCTELFTEAKKKNEHLTSLVPDRSSREEKEKTFFNNLKQRLINQLQRHKSGLFDEADLIYNNNSNPLCGKICDKYYEGRNLCKALSISRQFHEDSSQHTPRLEVFLGTYLVKYNQQDKDIFEFKIDAFLLLNGKERNECGFVVFKISLDPILKPTKQEGNSKLDNIIFLKHLFYKSRLKCKIGNQELSNDFISLQKWTTEYLNALFEVLKLDYDSVVNNYVKEAAFRYSLLELDNITISRNAKSYIILTDVNKFIQLYANQLYGLLVSDEGWTAYPQGELLKKFKDNYWSTRAYTCSFFYEHNVLIINQYEAAERKEYQQKSNTWYDKYVDINGKSLPLYQDYVNLEPCIPGIASLTFDAFLNAIYKDMQVERTQERLIDGNAEQNVKALDRLLQSYSMSLDEIKSLEDIICNQFSIKERLRNLQDRYHREAANVQDSKLYMLTQVTVSLSLVSVAVATFTVLLTILGHKDSGLYTNFSDTFADILVIGISLLTTICIVWASIWLIARPKIWNMIKNLTSK